MDFVHSYFFVIVRESCVTGFRKALYPPLDNTYKDPTQNISSEDENSVSEKFFLKIPGYGDVNVQDVNEWLMVDEPEFNRNFSVCAL